MSAANEGAALGLLAGALESWLAAQPTTARADEAALREFSGQGGASSRARLALTYRLTRKRIVARWLFITRALGAALRGGGAAAARRGAAGEEGGPWVAVAAAAAAHFCAGRTPAAARQAYFSGGGGVPDAWVAEVSRLHAAGLTGLPPGVGEEAA